MSSLVLRVYRASMTWLCAVTSAAMVGIVLLVLASTAIRYLGVFPGSLHWTSELTRFGMVWVVMLGAAIALDRGAHVAVDLLERLGPRPRRVVAALAYLLGLVFLGVVAVYGARLSLATMRQVSPALKLPVGYAYLAIPVGSALMLVQSLLFVVLPAARNASGSVGAASAGNAATTAYDGPADPGGGRGPSRDARVVR